MASADTLLYRAKRHGQGKAAIVRLIAALLLTNLAYAETAWLATYSAAGRCC